MYQQWAGKAGATDQLFIENQHVEDLITTPTGQEGHELEGADDKALEGASTIHNYSGHAGGTAQIWHVNPINDKSCPNLTMNNNDSSGYAGGADQIPHVNTINGKSHPNSTTNIHNSSSYPKSTCERK